MNLLGIEKTLTMMRAPKMPDKFNGIIDYNEWVKECEPTFYNSVMNQIDLLGHLTMAKGHSEKLDTLKQKAWSLIGLG